MSSIPIRGLPHSPMASAQVAVDNLRPSRLAKRAAPLSLGTLDQLNAMRDAERERKFLTDEGQKALAAQEVQALRNQSLAANLQLLRNFAEATNKIAKDSAKKIADGA